MAWLLLAFLAAMFGFGLKKGYIGIYGAAVHRKEHPALYWGQMSVAAVVLIMLIIVIANGDG